MCFSYIFCFDYLDCFFSGGCWFDGLGLGFVGLGKGEGWDRIGMDRGVGTGIVLYYIIGLLMML